MAVYEDGVHDSLGQVDGLDPEGRVHVLEESLVGGRSQELSLEAPGQGLHRLGHVLLNDRMSGIAASLVKDVLHIEGLQGGGSGGSSGSRRSEAQKVAGKVGRDVKEAPGLSLLNVINKRVAIPSRLVGLIDPGEDVIELTLRIHDLALDHSTHRVVVSDGLEELSERSRGLGVVETFVSVVEDNLNVLNSGHG